MRSEIFPAWALGPFSRPSTGNPVIRPNPDSIFNCPMRKQPIHWEKLHTFNPAAIVHNGKVNVLYRAEDDTGELKIGHHTSRLGLAESDDGIHFTTRPTPAFFPDNDNQKANEWDGGCEDPRIVEDESGRFILCYTQYNHKIPQLGIATSKDLLNWEKNGNAFARSGSKYAKLPTKSAGIVCELKDNRLITAKLHGKYWMYFGEHEMVLASSEDLINWIPQTIVLKPRWRRFDSLLTEIGPPPLLTDQGIIVFYNGKNIRGKGDPRYPSGVYCGGQALMDVHRLDQCVARLDVPYIKPEFPFEKTGQYAAGTTFTEGLVYFQHKWFLYYGCADSFVAVAISEGKQAKKLVNPS